VEPYGSDRSVAQADILHCLRKGGASAGLAADSFNGFSYNEKRRVRTGGVETGIVLIIRVDAGDEFLVVRCIEAGGIPAGGESIDCLLAHQLENALVGARGISEHGDFPFQPVIIDLLQES